MYICKDCKKRFLTPRIFSEPRGDDGFTFERFAICPNCNSDNIEQIEVNYCKCCGKRLPEGKKDYCNNRCRVKGQKMWIKELRRRREIKNDPLFETVLSLDEYNKEHGTRYSYGQFVSLILPKEIKNGNRKKARIS